MTEEEKALLTESERAIDLIGEMARENGLSDYSLVMAMITFVEAHRLQSSEMNTFIDQVILQVRKIMKEDHH